MTPDEYINVFSQKFEIIREPLIDEDGGVLFGKCDPSKNKIYINSEIQKEISEQTLLHEGLHAIDMALNLGLSEEAICGLENGLFNMGVKIKTKKRRINRNHKTESGSVPSDSALP